MGEAAGTAVRLTGALQLDNDGRHGTERDLPGRQPRLLFTVLVWEHGRMVAHGELAETLWPDQRPATWQPALRGLASKVRSILDQVGLDGASILTNESGCYRLDLPRGTVIDVEAAVAQVDEAARLVETGGHETARRLAGQARSVLSRPLLPGVDTPWLDRRRDELAVSLTRCLEVLGECRRRAGEHGPAAVVVEDLLAREPFRETAWRLLMRIHAGAGNLAEALRAYERCRLVLAEELGVDPSPETQQLHRQLLRSSSSSEGARPPSDERSNRRTARVTGPPYPGLRPFDEADARLFFGRDVEVTGLIERLAEHRFLAVVGPSGCGKSSLVHAGLLPALRSGALPESDTWHRIAIRPGERPLDTLASALLAARDDANVRSATQRLGRDDEALHDASAAVLVDGSGSEQLLVVIDQFEELFTVCPDATERHRFIATLLHAIRRRDARVVIVVTLRADFYGEAAPYPGLAEALSTSQLLVPALDGDGLYQAIEGPARLAGLTLEPGLTGRILADVAGEPGALPFLQHALLELYERRADHVLTRGAYEDIGAVAGALGHRAEEVWATLTLEQRTLLRRITLRLVQPGDGAPDTRRRTPVEELIAQPGAADEIERVITELVDHRLLVMSADPVSGTRFVEIAHEALLAGWPRLAGWIDDDRAGLLLHRRLTELAGEWEAHGRDPEFLLTGARLAEARGWASAHGDDTNLDEQAFLRASLDAEQQATRRRARRRRAITTGLTVGLLIVGTLAIVASTQRARADLAEDRARSREIAAEASNQLDLDPELGLLLALEAFEIFPTAQAEAALRQAFVRSTLRLRLASTGPDPMVEVSRDGALVASWAIGGPVKVWDADSGRPLAELRDAAGDTPTGLISAIAFGPEGRRLLASDLDGSAWVWSLPDGQLLQTFEWPSTNTAAAVIAQEGAAWTPDGSRVVVAGFDGAARVFDVASGDQVLELRGPGEGAFLARVRLGPDGSTLAVEGATGRVRVVDLLSGDTVVETAGHDSHLWALKLSEDGRLLLSASEDGTARLWHAGTGQPLHTFTHDAPIRDAAIDAAARKILTGDANGDVRIWDASTGERLLDLVGHEARVNQLRFDASGRLALTASLDGTARVWDAGTGALLGALIGSTQPVVDAEFSPDGGFVLTGGDDARIWHVPQGALSVIDAHDAPIHDLTFSLDGSRMVTGGLFDGLAHVIDRDDGRVVTTLEHAASSKPFVDLSPEGEQVLTVATYASPGLADRPDPPTVWATDTGQPLLTLALPEDDPLGVCGGACAGGQGVFSPDGTRIAIAGFDGRVSIHDADDGELVWATEPLPGWLTAIDWSPDGATIAARGFGLPGPVLLEAATGAELHRLPEQEGLSTGNFRFAPDGTLVAIATGSTVQVYELPSERLVAELQHRGAARDVAFSADATMLVTGSESGAAIWDLATQRQLARFPGTGSFSVSFTPDGEQIAVGGNDGAVRFYPCDVCQPVERLLDVARERVTRELTPNERERFLHDGQ